MARTCGADVVRLRDQAAKGLNFGEPSYVGLFEHR